MLGDEQLMFDLFTTSEIATLGLAYHPEQDDKGRQLDVVVGGLGLGYTAEAVLCDKSVGSLWVVNALQVVIDWHVSGLLPLGEILCADPRCKFVYSDFFASARKNVGFDATQPGRRFDAILVDINHDPDFHLATDDGFYSTTDFWPQITSGENGALACGRTIHLIPALPRICARSLPMRAEREGFTISIGQRRTQTIYLDR